MKRLFASIFATLLIAPASLMAQEPQPPPPGREGHEFRGDRSQRGGSSKMRGDRSGRRYGEGMNSKSRYPGNPKPYLDHWLEQVKAKNPEDFEKFRRMREEDPEGFHRALRERLSRGRYEQLLDSDPELKKAIEAMPEPTRKKLQAFFSRSPGPPRHSDGHRPDGPSHGPRKVSPEQALHKAYREAALPEAKARIKGELKQAIEQSYDRRVAERRKQIEQMEAQLTKLREYLEAQDSHRDEVIEKRLEQLTAQP